MKQDNDVEGLIRHMKREFLQVVAPCLMLICTAFTMQFIGHIMLDGRQFFRMIGGTIATIGMLFPLLFIDQQRRSAYVALGASIILSGLIANGYLCAC